MNQILSVWDALDPRKRIIAILATVAVFVAVLGLARMANTPSLSLLYAGLDPSTSGEIVTSLEARKVAYEVRGNAIYVESGKRDEVRMSLASEGLPANGIAGYELLDGLSGFGTTSQMFDAAYWRAKEGELARTILASPQVRAARVHISNTSGRGFGQSQEMAASVIITMNAGNLSSKQANAMRYLVSSAVSGMAPQQVSVIDSATGIVLAAGTDAESTGIDDIATKTASMRANIERLLAARVGIGNAIVEVNIDADMNSETITERVLDPEGRVAISSDIEEKSSTAQGATGNAVTVASNLPDGDAAGGDNNSSSSDSQVRERMNFEVSEVRRERIKHPGEIRRVSVAVLIDGITSPNETGEIVWQQRPAEELAELKELVQTAIGFDAARGDVVTISSMEFSQPAEIGTVAQSGAMDFLAVNAMTLIQLAVLGLVALSLGLFVLKPMFAAPPALASELLPSGQAAALPAVADGVDGEIELNPEVLGQIGGGEQRFDHLRSVVSERSEDSSEVLEDWLSDVKLEPEGA